MHKIVSGVLDADASQLASTAAAVAVLQRLAQAAPFNSSDAADVVARICTERLQRPAPQNTQSTQPQTHRTHHV